MQACMRGQGMVAHHRAALLLWYEPAADHLTTKILRGQFVQSMLACYRSI